MRSSLLTLSLAFFVLFLPFAEGADKIFIIGGGAVGVLFGSHLASENQVTIVRRNAPSHPQIEVSREQAHPVTLNQTHWGAIESFPHGALVFVTVKSFDLAETWKSLAPRLDGTQTVVLTQNGIGVAYEAPELSSYPNLVRALVLTGVKLEGEFPSRLVVAGQTAVRLASSDEYDGLEALGKTLAAANFTIVSSHRNIAQAEWLKALLNLYINGPTAIFDCTIGEVLDNPSKLAFAENLLEEAVAVARKEKINISELDLQAVRKKARDLAAHRTSMQQDIARKTPTEKKWLYGAVLAKAELHGLQAAYTARILHLLEKREAGHHPFNCGWQVLGHGVTSFLGGVQ